MCGKAGSSTRRQQSRGAVLRCPGWTRAESICCSVAIPCPRPQCLLQVRAALLGPPPNTHPLSPLAPTLRET